MMDSDSDSDTEFGIRTPPLLDYLQGILRGYTDGQILKELLQNAEDAGASEVRFLYDREQYGTEHLLDPRLGAFQGPALCSYNDAVFREDDWKAIQALSQSGKKDNALKVGRFGIGFSSVYHLTDLPCILSHGYFGIIDPFKEYFRNKHGDRQTGFKKRLKHIIHNPRYKDQMDPFRASLPDESKLGEGETFLGTVFRFPLRRSPSELSENVYTVDETNELLNAFNEDARIVLLFLRQVEKVTIFTKAPGSPGQKVFLDVSFEQSSLKEVQSGRKEFCESLQEFEEDPTTCSSTIAMTNTFVMKTSGGGTSHRHKWVVHHEIALECSDQLERLYQKLKFLPWIGVAIPLFDQDIWTGRLFCFLPLPPGESFSGLPVHVHGFFAVTDDRRSIQWPGDDRIQNVNAEWNKLLVDEVLPNAYRKALLKATEIVRDSGMGPSIVYAALPDIRTDMGHWESAIKKLYDGLFSGYPLLFCEAEQEWKTLDKVVLVPKELAGVPKMGGVVVKTLQTHYSIAVEVPDHVEQAVRQFNGDERFISPFLVLQCLEQGATFDDYSDEERLLLLEYLLKNKCTIKQLNKLPLLPTDDGGFAPFLSNPTPNGIVYVPTDMCPQDLVPNARHRFVRRLQGHLKDQLEDMAKSDTCEQLQFLKEEAVVTLLRQSLPESWCKQHESSVEVWDPSLTGELNLEWLERFWTFLSREQIDLKRLERLALLPAEIGATVTMRLVSPDSRIVQRPTDNETPANFEELVSTLTSLGVTVCSLPGYVMRHHQLAEFVPKMSANVIVNFLHDIGPEVVEEFCSVSSDSQQSVHTHLLPYLADASLLPWHKRFLKKIAVFSPVAGEFVALKSVEVILSEETKHALPDVKLRKRVCIGIPNAGLHQLFVKLDCFESKFEDILGYILDEACQNEYSSDEMEELLGWIYSNYGSIKMMSVVAEKLKNVAFVPNEKGECRKPYELFDRSDDIIKHLVLSKNQLPMESFFSKWQHILTDLGLKSRRDISTGQVVKIAKLMQGKKDKWCAKALVEFLFEFPEHISAKDVRDILASVPLLSCRMTPPDVYSDNIHFVDTKDKLFKPKDVVIYSEETCCLVGASVPLYDLEAVINEGDGEHHKVLKRLGVRKKPCIKDVLTQLHHCVSCSAVDRNHWDMLRYIYSFLNDKIEENPEILKCLPEKWIFLEDQFVESNRVYREEGQGTVDLRPYRSTLPVELLKYGKLLKAAGVSEKVDEDLKLLLSVLKEIQESKENSDRVRLRVSMNILRRLTELDVLNDDDIRQQLLIPTNSVPLTLLPPDQVCYCDTEWIREGLDADDIQMDEIEDTVLVHDTISSRMAEQFGIIPLSTRLAGASEIGYIQQTGQSEPLTVRLKNILRDGYQPGSIPKEMIQNAEDAGATEMRFVLDLRTNISSMEKLLDPAMREVHGPALWIHNNGVFSKKDLQNITKLGGATKREDCSKIGQFGLGFNSVYHITDVPSFVTGDVVTFFDPHRSHLRRHIRGDGTGIQLNFLSNPSQLKRFRDQFAPYEGLFGCNLLGQGTGPSRFNGTLFRLPLRSTPEARKSEICDTHYDEAKMKPLMKSLCESASQMLLFMENVRLISVYLFGADAPQPSLLYTIDKAVEDQGIETASFKTAILKSLQGMNDILPDQVTTMKFSSSWTEVGAKYFELPRPTKREDTWMTVSSMGKGKTRDLCATDIGKTSGLLPCGGVALCLTSETIGKIFSYLPLSITGSGLPVCVNGAFALSSDRRGIWREDGANMTTYAAFKSKWNDTLCEDAIVRAYLTLLHVSMAKINTEDDSFDLWPNPRSTGRNTDCGKVMTGFYHAVAHGMEGEESPSVFYGTGQPLSINDVAFGDGIVQKEEAMFISFKEIMADVTAKTVLRIPTWVAEGFEEAQCGIRLGQLTYSWDRFFEEIFLPNVNSLATENVEDMMKFALSLQDKNVNKLFRESECIPSSGDGGIIYKKPNELLDPEFFQDMFIDQDSVFPAPSFLLGLDNFQIETLRSIGSLRKDIEWHTVIERAKTIQEMWDEDRTRAKQRIRAILTYIACKMATDTSIGEDALIDLKSVVFLPAVRNGDDECIQCAELVYPLDKKELIGCVHHIINEDIPSSVEQLLGLGKDVIPEDFLENVDRVKQTCDGHIPDTVRHQWDLVYEYFECHASNPRVLEFLRTEKCFLVEQNFVEAGKLAKRSESIPPYLYQVPTDLLKFPELLKSAGVVDEFGYREIIGVLESIHDDHAGEPLGESVVKTVLAKIIKPLFDIADDVPIDAIPKIPIPDSDGVMCRSGCLAFCDLEQFEHLTNKYTLCHNEIPLPHAKRLGVRDIRDQMLKDYSQPLPGTGESFGEDFGQREELVGRIKRIMEGYPRDFSILKEIVQNADDARATKVHFVLDCRSHPTERLFYDTMRELQGPALLAYNDSPFSDEDIRGIQKLGEGSKGDDSDKTGRYGVGFNVVYHLTDCPMFMSEENTLCIFDPTLKYVNDANVASPGRMFRPINEEMMQSYADFFQSFLSFRNTFSLKCGSLFRFALRNHDSELGDKLSIMDVKGLFESFKEEMFDVLLFLKSVQQITISTWNDDGMVPGETYTVKAALSEEDTLARHTFFQGLSDQKNTPVSEIIGDHIQYQTVISDNWEHSETWLVHQRVGIKSKDEVPQSVKNSSLKLVPKGGIAAKLKSASQPPKTSQVFKGKCFCFLPLPLETKLPIHIDGYFALGHESRRNLWEGSEGDVRSDWNILIAREVIAPAYICLMEEIREGIERVTHGNFDMKELRNLLKNYHSFFPMGFLKEDATHRNIIDEVSRSFYLQIFKNNLRLFPAILPDYRSESTLPQNSNLTLSWKSCNSTAEEKGYFDSLFKQVSAFQSIKPLREVLLKLSFPLLETPLKVFNAMGSYLDEESRDDILIVSPQKVMEFLKTDVKKLHVLELPTELQETVIGHEQALQMVLDYILDSRLFPDVKLDGLPLLLTNDRVLREFATGKPVFHSKYAKLLPELGNEFLHETLVLDFDAEDECFHRLGVTDLAERLSSHLPVESRQRDCMMLAQDSSTDPTTEWLKLFWEFLYRSSENDGSPDMEQIFSDWCVFPARLNGGAALLPMNLAKTVLSSRESQYHKQTVNILMKLNAPITQTDDSWEDAGVCDFVNRYASDIESIPDILIVLGKLLEVNREGFVSLGADDCANIRQYINMQIGQLGESDIEMVKTLPCFESIDGEHTDLSTTTFAVSMQDFPTTEQEKWMSPSVNVLLKRESISDEMVEALGIKALDEVELYRRFILPCFETFTADAQWDHLTQLMKIVNNHDNPEEVINILKLTSESLIPGEDAISMPANYFRDPDNPVYAIMSGSKYTPPNHPNPSKQIVWMQFLRRIGMQKLPSCEQFQEFLGSVSNDTQRNEEREKILVGYLTLNHHLHKNGRFLQDVSSIEFITAATVWRDLNLLHEQSSTQKVSLSAISVKYCNIVWSTEPLLPDWLDVQLESKCCECNKPLKKILQTKNEPTMQQVLSHTKKIFTSLSTPRTLDRPAQSAANQRKSLLIKIITATLGYLSKQCRNAKLGSNCSKIAECCKECATIVYTLRDTAIIPLGDGTFFRASKLTKTLHKDRNDKLFTFLRQIPDSCNPYNPLLYCMGATEQPSLRQYASALEEIASLDRVDLSKNPPMCEAAHQAMGSFFLRLMDCDTPEVMEISSLHLLSKKGRLEMSTELFYNDEPKFARRLSKFPHPLMKWMESLRERMKGVSMEELLKKLGTWKPRLISEFVVEVPVDTYGSQIINHCRCSRAKQMRKVLGWSSFPEAMRCILHNKGVTDLLAHEVSLQTTFDVTCQLEIQTELRLNDHEILEKSKIDTGAILTKTGDRRATLLLSHKCKNLIDIQIAEEFIAFFGVPGVSDIRGLTAIFKTKSEADLMVSLSQLGLKTEDSEFERYTPPVLGSDIEEDVICLLLENILADFSPEEYVGYNVAQSVQEHLVYAKIIKRVETDDKIGTAEQFKVKYLIDAGEEKEVDAIWLYRFLRPEDNFPGPRSEKRDVVLYTGSASKRSSVDPEFSDLEQTKREVTEIIEALWKENERTRDLGLRRLMRQWHPDKNDSKHKSFAEEIFKHIRREIARLENGIPSGVDSEDDITRWARRNNENRSRYKTNHERRNRGGRGSQRQTGGSSAPPPSFTRFNIEASMWCRQAHIDLEAASHAVLGANFFQWKSSLCFFAAEKAVKAAQLVSGGDIDDDQDIMDAAIALGDDLDVTREVNDLLGLVEKTSHYPDSQSPLTPAEKFDEENANEVMDIAKSIVEKVDRYVDACN